MSDDNRAERLQPFPTHREAIADGFSIAFTREGVGGYPLVLLHGFPETRRIYHRNIRPLADAGFEVIVPDLRGFGDSDLAPDGSYDPVAYADDVYRLVHDRLGHSRVSLVGGDIGGTIAPHLALSHPEWVDRLCIFNTIVPLLDDAYRAAGIEPELPPEQRPVMDYYVRQGNDGDGLAAAMDSPERRRDYIAGFYTHRLWAGMPFDAAAVAFHTEPFADAGRFRACYGTYEVNYGKRPLSGDMRFFEPVEQRTLLLYGPADPILDERFLRRAEIAYVHHVGPFVVPGAGHFLQWERADILNGALESFLGDRLAQWRRT